jgi:hypothetical protein
MFQKKATMLRSFIKTILVSSLLISCSEDPIMPTLINITEELPGINCPNGGTKIETGVDRNNNKVLTADEVQQTKYICNPGPTLVVFTDEFPGANCPAGGTKIETGIDSDNNKVLTANEVSQTKYVCKSQDDKQIRLDIGPSPYNVYSTDYVLNQYNDEDGYLIKFNKLNYANVESIIFVPSMAAWSAPDQPTTCFVQLFNLTDNVAINNSELQSSVRAFVFQESGNILNDLPSKEVTLAMRVRTTNPNQPVSVGKSYLFINKK